jgi:hypothetical protein
LKKIYNPVKLRTQLETSHNALNIYGMFTLTLIVEMYRRRKKICFFALVNTSLDNDDFDTMTKLTKLKGKKYVQQNIFKIEFIVL